MLNVLLTYLKHGYHCGLSAIVIYFRMKKLISEKKSKKVWRKLKNIASGWMKASYLSPQERERKKNLKNFQRAEAKLKFWTAE